MNPLKPMWTIAHGATKYAAAWATGDRAPAEVIAKRRETCRYCPDQAIQRALMSDGVSSWCGRPFVDTGDTCGCLLAGKTSIASEACPQGKWVAVTIGVNHA